jgi:peptidoglycan/xylan/chitin deacetylase (PgdA/CDA1 family)
MLASLLATPLTLRAEGDSNHLYVEEAGKLQPPVVHGVIQIGGVADHPDFRKWQIDLLLGGVEATFLALGEAPQVDPGILTEVDTGRYPNGDHMLRLRVVHTDLNYEEYLFPVIFANGQGEDENNSTATATPTATQTSTSTPTQTSTSTATATVSASGAETTFETVTATATATVTPSPTATTTATMTATMKVTTTSAPTPTPSPNEIFASDKPVRGSVEIFGVAVHPDFRKWQIDLLISGDQTRETFIALGEEQIPTRSKLTTLDTALYPNGIHVLRLRVVHSNMNYDEYITQIRIDNPLVSSNGISTSGAATYNGGRPVYRGAGDEAVVYLTFDDGPYAPYTQQILDLLAKYNAKATFFVVGRAAQGSPDTIKAIYEAGHGIGNHSWSHRKLVGLSEKVFNEEMISTSNAIGSYAAACMRPPYGATDASTYSHSTNLGYSVVLWSIDPVDWKRPGVNAIANHVLSRAFPGAIVVMHDGGGDRSQTVAAVEIILRDLSAQGYTFKAYCR